jgi:hypothetical protein
LDYGVRVYAGVGPSRPPSDYARAVFDELDDFNAPPIRYAGSDAGSVSLAAYDGHPIENSAIGFGLPRKTDQPVSLALDLEPFQLSVDDCEINPRNPHEHTKLIDDARFGVAAVASL